MTTQIKELTLEQLLCYYHPEEVLGYCSRCKNHGKFWSCPPHSFDIQNYFQQFQYAYVIGVKVPLDKLFTKDEALTHYHKQKIELNERLQQLQSTLTDAKVLVAGECWHCKKCVREEKQVCVSPEKLSYSLESLGIKISGILEQEFNDKLQWQKDKMPESLYLVQAVLAKEKISQILLNEVLIP